VRVETSGRALPPSRFDRPPVNALIVGVFLYAEHQRRQSSGSPPTAQISVMVLMVGEQQGRSAPALTLTELAALS
jgi:hypothetical protein